MLKVQEFLKSGSPLRQLSQQYNIQCNISSNELVALNYTNLSPMNEDIVKECRGLFLQMETWDVVCKSFTAFGNVKEDTQFNWSKARLIEKLDGALICLYYYEDQWCIGMRMSADGSMQVTAINGVPTSLSFAELTKLTIEEMGYTWDEYTAKLDKNLFYSFELCGPETRCGVIYSKRKLVLIGAIKKDDLSEIDLYSLDFPLEKPKYIDVTSKEEADKLMTVSDPLKNEGYVLVDDNFNRMKFKNPNYISMMSDPDPDDELEALEQLLQYVITFSSGPDDGCGS